MRLYVCALCAAFLLLAACQPRQPGTLLIVDGETVRPVQTDRRAVSAILAQAGITLADGDRVLHNGQPVAAALELPALSGTLQVRRAVELSLNGKSLRSAAWTVGEALEGTELALHAADGVFPAPNAPLQGGMSVQYVPARPLTIRADGADRRIWSSASTVGAALTQAGLPLLGLDYSRPAEGEPLPADGQIQVVRVSEAIQLVQQPIPFKDEYTDSADVPLGQEQIVQPGVQGLSVSRVRIRYEDGQEVSRQTEAETVVRAPQNRVSARGTKIEIQTATINGVTIQYWRQLQMYATVYSPCTSGGSGCSSGTASGMRAGKGVVAVDPGLYAYLQGQRLYIPGYGPAVIGDIGGGYIIEQNLGVSRYRWIDLGFDDNNIVDMTGWVTVYFLAPAPASIPEILK